MSDHKGFQSTLAISRVLVAASGRLFAGSGDRANGGYWSGYANGLYFSDDQGTTWAHVDANPSCANGSVVPSGVITQILQSPTDRTTIYIGASTGVFHTTDGICWTQIFRGSVFDLAAAAAAPAKGRPPQTLLFAAINASTNLIQNAVQVTRNPDAPSPTWSSTLAATGAGAPQPLIPNIARILLATSGGFVYALVAQAGGNGALGVFRAPIRGAWVQRNQPLDANGSNRCDGQCWYSVALGVNPTNSNDVYVGTVTAFRSTDGGQSWVEFNPSESILSDQHSFAFHPTNSNLMFVGNDSGVQSIVLNPLGFWTFRNSEMQTGLFYYLALSASQQTQRAVGGLQDAGSQLRLLGRTWLTVGGGDGKFTSMDAVNPVLAYFQQNSISVQRSTDGNAVGVANFFASDPYRAGAMLGVSVKGLNTSQLYYASQVDTTGTAQWGCIDPTPGANPPPNTTAIAFGPGGGLYYVGNSAGAIYQVRVPAGSPALLVWPGQLFPGGTSVAQGQVIGIAVDPQQPSDVLYATTGSYNMWRVVKLVRNAAGSWIATPIAGAPGTPGAFPNVSACQFCTIVSGTFLDPIAADPIETGKLYVGTDAGLMVGVPDKSGNYQWSQDLDVPETWVTNVVARQSTLGAKGIVRLSTFGRGIWERVRLADVRIPPSIEPNIPYRGFIDPLARVTVAVLPVDYRHEGAPAALRVSPTVKGNPSPFFLRTPRAIRRGEETVFVTVGYANALAPIGLTTDGLDVELVDDKGRAQKKWHIDRELRWMRSDARAIVVQAELEREGIPAPLHITAELVAREKVVVTTPESIAVPKDVPVALSLPAEVATPFGKAKFMGWVAVADAPHAPRVTITASAATTWKARYRVTRSERRQERERER